MRFLPLLFMLVFAPCFAQHGLVSNDIDNPGVDVALVLAVDISYSTPKDDLARQRDSYADAVASEEFLKAVRSGSRGRVAITYFEWSAAASQRVVVPWRMIDGSEAAAAVAAEIRKAPVTMGSRTSISGAIKFATLLFANSPYQSTRRVIDIAGNGPNNSGELVEGSRDAALAGDITINGLSIMVKPTSVRQSIDDLNIYYEDCVTGGPNSFVMAIKERDDFKEVIQTMLVAEIADRRPDGSATQAVGREKRISCTIGEQKYESFWNGSPGALLPSQTSQRPPPPPKFWPWQYAGFVAHTQKCFLRQKERIRDRVELTATIGPDGMIVGNPDVRSPIDSDAFRREVGRAIKKLEKCQPYIVDPYGRTRTTFKQGFKFQREETHVVPIMPLPIAAR